MVGAGTMIGLVLASVARYWYSVAEQPAPTPHLAHPKGCAALRIVLVTVPRISRSCEHFPDPPSPIPVRGVWPE